MPAIIAIYVIIGWFMFRAKTEKGRIFASKSMIVVTLFFLALLWLGPNPGIVQG